jgi:hypothetical protein
MPYLASQFSVIPECPSLTKNLFDRARNWRCAIIREIHVISASKPAFIDVKTGYLEKAARSNAF